MKLSNYFLPLLKEKPNEAHTISHILMLRAGMIRQHCAGIYNWLPLGCATLKNIQNIVNTHMQKAGSMELIMPLLQSYDLWTESGRAEIYGKELLRISDRHNANLIFGPTAEEIISDIFRKNIYSYKELPKIFHQIQWKFRDEIRPRFGVMRAREFLLKDSYSFDTDKNAAVLAYKKMYKTYLEIFKDLGVFVIPTKADPGPIGGDLSHEFHVIAPKGESKIYYDKKLKILLSDPDTIDYNTVESIYAAADDLHDKASYAINEDDIEFSTGIEVGHIFHLGTKYSSALGAVFANQDGSIVDAEMNCYGIGISRLIAAIIESNHDERGIIWPESIAPFKVSIINLNVNDAKCNETASMIHNAFQNNGFNALYDDTDNGIGQKFACHDLIGSPWQIIVGKNKVQKNIIELKHRKSYESEDMNVEDALKKLIGILNIDISNRNALI